MTRTVRKRDIVFDVDEGPQAEFWDWFESPSWEPDTVEALMKYSDEATTYIDVGAWIGDTALLVASRVRRVVAFEPDPSARASLIRNLRLNPALTNVEVREEALSSRSGRARLAFGGSPGDSLTQLDARTSAASDGVARLLDIREFIASEPGLSEGPVLLKMDIEGSEYEAIPAAKDFLASARPHLIISFHPNLRYRKLGVFPRITSGMTVLMQNWRILWATRRYKFQFTWNDGAGRFVDRRWVNRIRLLVPVPLRSSLLIGTYLFTDDDRR